MNNRRLLYLALIVATLSIGVVIGTIVSGGVTATVGQAPAPLVIPDPVSLSNAFSQIASQVDPSVVNIDTQTRVEPASRTRRNAPSSPFDFFDFFGDPDAPQGRRSSGVGSGFVVDNAGYILTNHHVVDGATEIRVTLDDRSTHTAEVIGSDEETDLAVIKIDAGRELPAVKMGNSDPVKVGDWVLALGSPFGLDHSVTAGIISAKGRENLAGTSNAFQSFLQTDAAINPGNSGGPLVNMAGEVIGVNTAIISENRQSAGLGFALPSNTAIKIYNQLVQNGKVTRGGIGISYSDNPALAPAFGIKANEGIIVQNVFPGQPAAKAGLRPGDVITEIDGRRVTSGSVLLDIIANSPIGTTIQVKLDREGRQLTLPVVIDNRETVLAENATTSRSAPGRDAPMEESRLGIQVQAITPDMVRSLGLMVGNGVVISAVEPGSPAEEAGLTPGTIITQMRAGREAISIRSVEDYRQAEAALRPGQSIALAIQQRDPRTNEYVSAFVPLRIP